jgi:hypothetical protein
MAIAFDAATNGGIAETGTSVSFAHTCSGNDRLLLVAMQCYEEPTSIKYNNVDMVQLVKSAYNSDLSYLEIWGLLNPSTGSNNVVLSGNNNYWRLVSASYTGVKQSGLPDNFTSQVSASATNTLSKIITTVADNCWVAGTGCALVLSSVSGITQRGITSNAILDIGDSNGAITPAGNFSMTANATVGTYKMSVAMVSFEPTSSPSGFFSIL